MQLFHLKKKGGFTILEISSHILLSLAHSIRQNNPILKDYNQEIAEIKPDEQTIKLFTCAAQIGKRCGLRILFRKVNNLFSVSGRTSLKVRKLRM